MSSSLEIQASVADADLVIGAVLIPGAVAPKLVTREMVAGMKAGSVIVDVAIDQGGCVETAHPTTHSDPVYVVDDVIHYCVANMPGGVPITSTMALTNATLPYVEAIADRGLRAAVAADPALAKGVNVLDGKVTYEAVAEAHGLAFTPLDVALAAGWLAAPPLALAGLAGLSLELVSGNSLITPYVTPAASPITQAMNNASPRRPSTVVTALG